MKISHKFLIIFGVIALGMLALLSAFVYANKQVNERIQQISEQTLVVINQLNAIGVWSSNLTAHFENEHAHPHPLPDTLREDLVVTPDAITPRISASTTQFWGLVTEYSRTVDAFFPDETELRDKVLLHAKSFTDTAERLAEAHDASQTAFDAAMAANYSALIVERTDLLLAIDAAMQKEQAEITERISNIRDAVDLTTLAVTLGFCGLAVLMASAALYIIRLIVHRIETLRNAAAQVGAADLSVRIGDDSSDELGELARTFDAMAGQLSTTMRLHKQAEEELRELNYRLESLVLSRTEEYRQAKEHAESANQAKTKFLSLMSHELRTPLNAIMGFTQMLNINEFSEEARNEYVGIIVENCRILLSEINQLLVLSKLSNANLGLTRQPVPLRRVIDACVNQSVHLARDFGVKIVNETTPETLPCVMAQEEHLKTILNNLLANAIKYNRPENAQVTIRDERVSDTTHRIMIEDTGLGFTEDHPGQALEPFERLDRYGSTIDGIGVGLTIVNSFLANINGKLGYESTPGSGSRFWIDLELSRNQEAA